MQQRYAGIRSRSFPPRMPNATPLCPRLPPTESRAADRGSALTRAQATVCDSYHRALVSGCTTPAPRLPPLGLAARYPSSDRGNMSSAQILSGDTRCPERHTFFPFQGDRARRRPRRVRREGLRQGSFFLGRWCATRPPGVLFVIPPCPYPLKPSVTWRNRWL